MIAGKLRIAGFPFLTLFFYFSFATVSFVRHGGQFARRHWPGVCAGVISKRIRRLRRAGPNSQAQRVELSRFVRFLWIL
jgi:hypothetical protein